MWSELRYYFLIQKFLGSNRFFVIKFWKVKFRAEEKLPQIEFLRFKEKQEIVAINTNKYVVKFKQTLDT